VDTRYIRYRRTTRAGVEQEKLAAWIPVELKDRLRRVAAARREPMIEAAARAIAEYVDRAEQETD